MIYSYLKEGYFDSYEKKSSNISVKTTQKRVENMSTAAVMKDFKNIIESHDVPFVFKTGTGNFMKVPYNDVKSSRFDYLSYLLYIFFTNIKMYSNVNTWLGIFNDGSEFFSGDGGEDSMTEENALFLIEHGSYKDILSNSLAFPHNKSRDAVLAMYGGKSAVDQSGIHTKFKYSMPANFSHKTYIRSFIRALLNILPDAVNKDALHQDLNLSYTHAVLDELDLYLMFRQAVTEEIERAKSKSEKPSICKIFWDVIFEFDDTDIRNLDRDFRLLSGCLSENQPLYQNTFGISIPVNLSAEICFYPDDIHHIRDRICDKISELILPGVFKEPDLLGNGVFPYVIGVE